MGNDDLAEGTVWALVNIGHAAVPDLVEALKDDNEARRAWRRRRWGRSAPAMHLRRT
jgi:hypothetical protein